MYLSENVRVDFLKGKNKRRPYGMPAVEDSLTQWSIALPAGFQ